MRGGDSCWLRYWLWNYSSTVPYILQSNCSPRICSSRLSLWAPNVHKRRMWSDTRGRSSSWANEQGLSVLGMVCSSCFWFSILLMIFMFSEWISIATIKTFWYVAVTSILVYFNIPQEAFYILASLMFIDTITGIAKQYRVESIWLTSKRMSIGIMAKFVTLMFLFSGWLVINFFKIDPEYYIQTVMSILIMAEFYSIIQNVYAVRTGIILPEYDAISIALKRLTGVIQDFIEKLTTLPKKK